MLPLCVKGLSFKVTVSIGDFSKIQSNNTNLFYDNCQWVMLLNKTVLIVEVNDNQDKRNSMSFITIYKES